jgi:hypothetical protein
MHQRLKMSARDADLELRTLQLGQGLVATGSPNLSKFAQVCDTVENK